MDAVAFALAMKSTYCLTSIDAGVECRRLQREAWQPTCQFLDALVVAGELRMVAFETPNASSLPANRPATEGSEVKRHVNLDAMRDLMTKNENTQQYAHQATFDSQRHERLKPNKASNLS